MMVWALSAVALTVLLWSFLCAPARGRRRADSYRGAAFAHRGLYGLDCPENSRAAFARACEAGYGVELDVQMTRDGHLVVFHDDDAARMTGRDGLIRDMTLSEVRALNLAGSAEGIPTLDEVLATVDGRAPMLIEIKTAPGIGAITEKAVKRLKSYRGAYVVESFDPLCLFWLRKNAPEIIRGILVQRYADYRETQSPLVSFFASSLLANALARPDFIAHSREMGGNLSLWLCANVFRAPTAQWTVTERAERAALTRRGVMAIFEETD
jgi:glycerophosphoryl diester phosphodiesterase